MMNSLFGTSQSDQVSVGGVTALSNGNYVVSSLTWDNSGVRDVGAVTWGNGATGITGAVTTSNSLIGPVERSFIGLGGVTALTNGNYVVASPRYSISDSTTDVGAATWGNGTTGITGTVSIMNSLVGTSQAAQVSSGGVTALTNGNYVVASPSWSNATTLAVGAATWGDGTKGLAGVISQGNSLVGSHEIEIISNGGVTALSNGDYVVASPRWRNGSVREAGAATWGSGTTGVTGSVSPLNSLVGSALEDRVSSGGIIALSDGNYVVSSPACDNGSIIDAGAVTCGMRTTVGAITPDNSVQGMAPGAGNDMVFDHDVFNHQLVVGRPAENIVTLFEKNIPPSISCPQSIIGLTARPGDPTGVVAYPPPTSSGGNVSCAPPSGSAFPVGVTIVTCTVTDGSVAQATCSFTATLYDACLQDDSNPNQRLIFNSFNGDYVFSCGGQVWNGTGSVLKRGGDMSLTHNFTDRRVRAMLSASAGTGNASIQAPPGAVVCTITDRNIGNNDCLR